MNFRFALVLGLLSGLFASAQTQAAKTNVLTVAPLDQLREQLQPALESTHPDFVVFRPQLTAEGVNDSGNEHFLVFGGINEPLRAVWTQSTREGAPDQHIVFSHSPDAGKTWSEPKIIAGPAKAGQGLMSSWGFPLMSKSGRIYVLYSQHVGKYDTFPHTTGQLTGIYSDDGGLHWSAPQTVPVPRTSRDNPDTSFPANCITWQKPQRLTKEGKYVVGLTRWTSKAVKTNPTKSWVTHDSVVEFIRFENVDENPEPGGLKITPLAWDATAVTVPVPDHPETSVVQEPGIVKLPDGRLFCVMRTAAGSPYWTQSRDEGKTWSRALPLLRKDGGKPLPHPLSPCPIFDLGGDAAGSGRYALFLHNHDGHYQGYGPFDTSYHRRPIYKANGHFQPGAEQPVWFEEPEFFMDHNGVPLGAPGGQGRVDLALYSSLTLVGGKPVLWYPDRKFFLLGKYLTNAPAAGAGSTNLPNLQWRPLTNAAFEVRGLPWFTENDGRLIRLPAKAKDSFRPAVWSLANSPSGGRVRFRTDSQVLALRLEYPGAPNMANMHAFGQTGVDVYADGSCIYTATADKDSKPGRVAEVVCFNFTGETRKEREISLYLPLYKGLTLRGIGLDEAAAIKPARPFANPRPVVFYGTSVTQGGAASRPGMSYPAIISRKLDLDFVNLGFSGNGLGEPAVAAAVAEIDAACFFLDFGANHKTFDEMKVVYTPFIETLRRQHPETPILVLSPIYTAREGRSEKFHADWQQRREFMHEVVKSRVAAGDRHIVFVEGTELLGAGRADGLVDGSHPNDLGFQWMADGLAPRIKELLQLP